MSDDQRIATPIGALVLWHGEHAPDWGEVVDVEPDRLIVNRRRRQDPVSVRREDVFASADTLAALDDAYHEHVDGCAVCVKRRQEWFEQWGGKF